MKVQAAPNTHPGGFQGACLRLMNQSEFTPLEVNIPPIPRAAKFIRRNIPVVRRYLNRGVRFEVFIV